MWIGLTGVEAGSGSGKRVGGVGGEGGGGVIQKQERKRKSGPEVVQVRRRCREGGVAKLCCVCVCVCLAGMSTVMVLGLGIVRKGGKRYIWLTPGWC